MLKLIAGSLIGDIEYKDVYDGKEDADITEAQDKTQSKISVPTLVDTVCKVAQRDGTQLDEKQYITYEFICCTLFLGLIQDGQDPDTQLGSCLAEALTGSGDNENMGEIIHELKARGGKEQLVMFLTGPAGAGKSTAVTIAQRFCFEFCRAIGNLWSDSTFLFTAYTGSAASLFGGRTICKASFIQKVRALSEDDKREW